MQQEQLIMQQEQQTKRFFDEDALSKPKGTKPMKRAYQHTTPFIISIRRDSYEDLGILLNMEDCPFTTMGEIISAAVKFAIKSKFNTKIRE